MNAPQILACMLAAAPLLAPVAAFAAPDADFLADAMKGDNK